MYTVIRFFSVVIVFFGQSLCQEKMDCGRVKYPFQTTGNGIDKTIPWEVLLVSNQENLQEERAAVPGILISPSLVFLSARYLPDESRKPPHIFESDSQYTVVLGSHNSSNDTSKVQRIPVSSISVHSKFRGESGRKRTNHVFALAHLKYPVQISERVQPVCIPSIGDKSRIEDASDFKPIFVIEWLKNYTSHYKGFQLEVLNSTRCEEFRKDKGTRRNRNRHYCAVVSKTNDGDYCPSKLVRFLYWSNGSYFFGGHVWRSYKEEGMCTINTTLTVSLLTNETLQWIQNSKRCGPNKFTCYSDGRCIQMSNLCDGKIDCKDSSDEIVQYCPEREYDAASTASTLDFKSSAIWIISFCAFSGAVLVIGYLYFQVKRLKKHLRDLTKEEVDEFFKGLTLNATNDPSFETREKQEERLVPLYINSSVLANPWNDVLEISEKLLDIREELDRGEFGVVYKGSLNIRDPTDLSASTREVAVKTQLPEMGADEFKNLLREVKITAHVGSHDCIVSIIGACTQNIKKRKIYLVVEYCSNGNLLKFVQRLDKQSFARFNTSENRKIPVTVTKHSEVGFPIAYSHFFKWASQIASGMAHLGRKNVIHGDLAARNILLGDNLDAKICDFGLSRELTDNNIYVKTSDQPIPWKWLALESFTSHTFSYASDVWAYGVTLWEIFSLGESPYGDIPCNRSFVLGLQNGSRLPNPDFASPQLYEILLNTWNEDPSKRPGFGYLELFFSELAKSCLEKSELK